MYLRTRNTYKQLISTILLIGALIGVCLFLGQKTVVLADSSDFVMSSDGTLTSYRGIGGEITIPNGVKKIGKNAFKGNSSITSVIFPNSITTIESSAFDSCGSLTKVKLPSKLQKIEDYAFWACTSLTEVEIPSSVTEVGFGAFGNCESLDSIYLSSDLTTIGNYAFGHYYQTTYAPIPEFTILGEADSAAQTYAEKYGLTFLTQGDITAKISKVTNSKKGKVNVSWLRNSNTTGYEIQYSTNKMFSKAKTVTAPSTKASKSISSMKKGSTYYFRVRGYRTVAGKKYYSTWSETKSVKIKK